MKSSYLQSKLPGRVHSCPVVGGIGVGQNDPGEDKCQLDKKFIKVLLESFSLINCIKTWCHNCPVHAPAIVRSTVVSVEEDVYRVGPGHYDWWLEVGPRRRRRCGVATASVHQGRPIAVRDFHVVVRTLVCCRDRKVGELHPQGFAHLNLDGLCFIKIVWITSREVW